MSMPAIIRRVYQQTNGKKIKYKADVTDNFHKDLKYDAYPALSITLYLHRTR